MRNMDGLGIWLRGKETMGWGSWEFGRLRLGKMMEKLAKATSG